MTNLVKLAIEGQFEQIPTLSMEEYNELEAGVEKSQAEIAAELDDAEKTMTVVSALEDLAFVADTIDTPNPREAALIQIAADAAMIGTGVDGSAIVPAMEEGGDGKSIATRIKDIIARILAALKEMLLNLYKKIKDYLDETERLAQQLKKKVAELREKAKDLRGRESKSMEVTTLYIGQRVADPVQLKDGKAIISAIAEYNKFVTAYTKGSSTYLTELENYADQFYSACSTDDRGEIQAILKKMVSNTGFSWLMPYVENLSVFEDHDRYNKYLTGKEFLGCMEITAYSTAKSAASVDAEPQKLADAFVEITTGTVINSWKHTRQPSEKITMMSLKSTEIDALLDHVAETVTDISRSTSRGTLVSEFKHHADKFDALVGKISKIAKSFENKQGDNAVDFIPYLNTINKVSSKLSKSSATVYSSVIANNIDIAKRSLAIVSASLDAVA